MKIFKYVLEITDKQTIIMPKNSLVLSVKTQFDTPVLYVLVGENETETEEHIIITYGTGQKMREDIDEIYIGTYLVKYDELVFHVFEEFVDGYEC